MHGPFCSHVEMKYLAAITLRQEYPSIYYRLPSTNRQYVCFTPSPIAADGVTWANRESHNLHHLS